MLRYSSPNLSPEKKACQSCLMLNVFKDYINDNLMEEPRALTLTLKPKKLCPYVDDHDIHRYIHTKIQKSHIWKKLKYIIRPEYDNNGRLHYHGIVYADSIEHISNAVKWWRRTFGFVNKNWNEEIKYLSCDCFKRDNEKICYWAARLRAGEKKKFEPSYCWSHYLFKDYKKTGLWTIYLL